MKRKYCVLLLLYFGLSCSREVYAENDHDVKRGMHPYMAFIYYSDPSILDASGQRFVRSAVLIRPDWLVTTAIGPSLMDPPNGFPKKTLLARAGAVTIDAKFTLNEDEDEQEREIIQIVRPYNHSATQWWTTDISLMKTLFPFNLTSAVGIKTLNMKPNTIVDAKVCSVLVYAKIFGNTTEDKSLMMLYVDMLPASLANCGSHFTANTMACATDSEENKDTVYDPNFCQGNSGGPLVCDTDVVGLQTYIGNDCKEPHLYQLLSAWDMFITCGIEDKCHEEHCAAICDVFHKDAPIMRSEIKITSPVTHDTAREIIDYLNVPSTPTSETTETTIREILTEPSTTITPTTLATISETETDITSTTTSSTVSEEMTTKPPEIVETTPTTNTTVTTNTTMTTNTTVVTRSTTEKVELLKHVHHVWSVQQKDARRLWGNESDATIKGKKSIEDNLIEKEREVNMEAQHVAMQKLYLSASNRNMCVVQTMAFGFIGLTQHKLGSLGCTTQASLVFSPAYTFTKIYIIPYILLLTV